MCLIIRVLFGWLFGIILCGVRCCILVFGRFLVCSLVLVFLWFLLSISVWFCDR